MVSRPSMNGVHHLAFRTRRLDALTGFYRDVMGLPVVQSAPDRVWLDLGGGAVLMLEAALPDEPEVPTGSMEFVAFGTDADGVEALARRCTARGVAVEHRSAWTVYVRDPDGRRVGASCYPFPASGQGR